MNTETTLEIEFSPGLTTEEVSSLLNDGKRIKYSLPGTNNKVVMEKTSDTYRIKGETVHVELIRIVYLEYAQFGSREQFVYMTSGVEYFPTKAVCEAFDTFKQRIYENLFRPTGNGWTLEEIHNGKRDS